MKKVIIAFRLESPFGQNVAEPLLDVKRGVIIAFRLESPFGLDGHHFPNLALMKS